MCDIRNRRVAKLAITGDVVWTLGYPKESNLYQKPEQYCPTNLALLHTVGNKPEC